jgi:hypothetical protein
MASIIKLTFCNLIENSVNTYYTYFCIQTKVIKKLTYDLYPIHTYSLENIIFFFLEIRHIYNNYILIRSIKFKVKHELILYYISYSIHHFISNFNNIISIFRYKLDSSNLQKSK